jgi:hypothetical protein
MTISSTNRRAGPYSGNGSQTAFPFSFKVFEAADMLVVKVEVATNIETTLALTTDYTVALNADQNSNAGGTVNLLTALPSGYKMVISSKVAYLQETDLTNQGGFYPEVITDALDRLTIEAQQLKEGLDRAAQLPITSSADAAALVADIVRIADSADNLDTVATNIDDVNTVADDIADVTTVSGIAANVTTVAGIASNVTTVAGIAANVTSVAGNATNINAVAGNATNINAVNANKTNIDAVAGNATNINAVNANKTNIDAVAANETNIDAVAANETNIDTVAGINANVTTVAGISSDVSAVAADATDIGTVATNIADVNTVADNIADVNTAADNIAAIIDAPNQATAASNSAIAAAASAAAAAASYDSFDDRYLGSKTSDPTVDNDGNPLVTGALYYSSTEQAMKVYDGATWILASSAGAASMNVFKFVATAGQTTFSGAATVGGTLSYTSGNIIVFLNGVALDAADYTASNGTSVVLGAAAAANDEIVIVAFKSFTVADTYSQTAADARFLNKTNITAGKVLGRDTSGSGAVQELPIEVSSTGLVTITSAGGNIRYTVTDGTITARLGVDSGVRAYVGSQSAHECAIRTNGSDNLIVDASGNTKFNSGYGSVATAYGCRAWVNFNGTGTVAIRASGNVSSITDNSSGSYTVNFTTAMPDGAYSALISARRATTNDVIYAAPYGAYTGIGFSTSSFSIRVWNSALGVEDPDLVSVAVFR